MGSRVETPTWLGSSHQWPWWHSPPQLLSSRATPATPSSCRSRDLTPVLESLEQHTHRKMELCSERSTTTSTTMTVSPSPSLSTPTTLLITLSTFWTGTSPGTWLAASSPHLPPDLFSLLTTGGRTSHQARSSWIGSLKVSTSTSGLSRAEPTKLQLDVCVLRENVQSFYLFSFGLISTYSIKHQ